MTQTLATVRLLRPADRQALECRKPRILLLGALPPPYIGPTLATEVLLFSELNDEFTLLHLDTSDHRPISTLAAFDLTNIAVALGTYLRLLQKLVFSRPDLVYIPISQTTIGFLRDSVGIVLSRLFGRKVVCHLRGANFRRWLDGASRLTRAYVKIVYRCVDAQIVLGECLRELFRDIIPGENVFVVPNGKDVELPPKSGGREVVRVLFLANMMRTKGVLDALHCVRPVYEQAPHVEFMFAGAWNEPDVRNEIAEFLAREKDLPITWIGEIHGPEKYQLLRAADVFLFPTFYPPEGHPWVIVEAMAAGLPIVSTDQGAIRESVVDGVNGLIVDKNSPSQVAEAVLRISGNAALRERMGNASRQLYEDKFTEAHMVERLRACFENVLGVAG